MFTPVSRLCLNFLSFDLACPPLAPSPCWSPSRVPALSTLTTYYYLFIIHFHLQNTICTPRTLGLLYPLPWLFGMTAQSECCPLFYIKRNRGKGIRGFNKANGGCDAIWVCSQVCLTSNRKAGSCLPQPWVDITNAGWKVFRKTCCICTDCPDWLCPCHPLNNTVLLFV